MAFTHSVPQTYDAGSTVKIRCVNDISQDVSLPNVAISKIFPVFETMPFTNSCTVALQSQDRSLVLKAMDPRYSIKFRRSLGLPDTFNDDSFYEVLQSPDIEVVAKRMASNLKTIQRAMTEHSKYGDIPNRDYSQPPLIDNTEPGSGLLEFLSLFTTTKKKVPRFVNEGVQLRDLKLDLGLNVATILRHPGLSELAACLIMEQDFTSQYTNWSTLTNDAAKGVSTLVTSCIVYTTSEDGNWIYACGGLITLEVPGSTGTMLGPALAEVAKTPEKIEYCIHEFESFLLTLSYFNLSLRGLRSDNLILATSSSQNPQLVLIDAGTVGDDYHKKKLRLYTNQQEERALELVRHLLGVTTSQLYETHGIADWDDIENNIPPSKGLDWRIIISDIKHFSSRREAVAMAPYTATITRLARVILLHDHYKDANYPWPVPQLQKLQRVISFHSDSDQAQSFTASADIMRNLALIKARINKHVQTTKAIEEHVSTQRVLDHQVWQREAKALQQMQASIGEASFEEWVARKFDALRAVTGIRLHRRDIVVGR